MNVIETVKSIISKRADISGVSESDPLSSLGLDSLDLVEVMLEIEDALGIEFASDEIADLKSIKDVVELINKKIK